jgi:class 3 adenylate cyclase
LTTVSSTLWAVSYALHAALGIQQAFAAYAEELWRAQAITLDMRMGVAAGTVAIGMHQNDMCLDYTSQGFALYLADRLQALATGSTLHVSEAIQQRALGFFRFKNLEEFSLPEIIPPVRVYACSTLEQATSPALPHRRAMPIPCLDELARLFGSWNRRCSKPSPGAP